MPTFRIKEIHSKSLINSVKGMPFAWSINPYRGCRHACVYCYARPTHEFLGLNGADEFQEVIFAKVNAAQLAATELGKRTWKGETVVIGTATDPYQQAESGYRLTRQILEVFCRFGNPVAITTKSPMILRDLDLLRQLAQVAEVTVCMTVTTLNEKLWRELEPTTAKPKKRLEAVSLLNASGIRAGVLMSPVLPGLTDNPEHMESVIAAASEAEARFVSAGVLRLGPGISEYYLPFVERTYPHLKAAYESLYRGNYAPAYYSDVINSHLRRLRAQYGIPEERQPVSRESVPLCPSRPHQLPLFQKAAYVRRAHGGARLD
jgi:DNA repair photolyase